MVTVNKNEKNKELEVNCVTSEMKNQILETINKYQLVSMEQVAAMLGSEECAVKALAYLSDTRKIFTTKDGYIPHISLSKDVPKLIIYKRILWLILALQDKLGIDDVILQPVTTTFLYCTFLARNELFDILYVPKGAENAVSMYTKATDKTLSEKESSELHRIIIIDDKNQKDRINCGNVDLFVTVSSEGKIDYI